MKIGSRSELRQTFFELVSCFDDKTYNYVRYLLTYKRWPNIKHPKDYSEVLMAMKITGPSELQIQCSDKAGVKDYISSIGLDDHIIKPYDVCNDIEDLRLDEYPIPYVVKVSNASKWNYLVLKKADIDEVKKSLSICRHRDYRIYYREPCYHPKMRKYVVEPWISTDGHSLEDYKVFCFNGEPTYIQYNYPDSPDKERIILDFYNKPHPYVFSTGTYAKTVPDIKDKLAILYDLAKKASKPFVYVRVDCYIIESKVIVGEMTFYPSGGWVLSKSNIVNRHWGSQIHWKGSDLRDRSEELYNAICE
jgi:hypothetical protein